MPFVSLVDPVDLPTALQGGSFAIGNFDGVHRGHRAVIDAAIGLARQRGGPALALTFEPHPRQLFRPQEPLFRLTSPETKAMLFERAGLDGAVTFTFDRVFAETTAESFLSDLLARRLSARAVSVGHDFSFGKGRGGSADFLSERAAALGLDVLVAPALAEGDTPVSSSAIRAALRAGDVARANHLLGHEWFVRAVVEHGEKIGRTLGYPTANMRFDPGFGLAEGVYGVRAVIDGVTRPAVASFGRRPTFDNGAPLLETFVFDFSGDLYGKAIDIVFVGFIRGQEKFDTIDALIRRMDEDSRIARAMTA